MKKKIAEELCSMVEGIIDRMQAVNNHAIASCNEAETKRIVSALVVCLAELDIEILAPIHREYPELKPSFLL